MNARVNLSTDAPGVASAPGGSSGESLLAASDQARLDGDHLHGLAMAEPPMPVATMREDRALEARGQALAAAHHLRLGNHAKALGCGRRALELHADLDDPAAHAQAQCTVARTYHGVGLHEQALSHALEGLKLARRCEEPRILCLALDRVGHAYAALSDAEASMEFTREALDLAQKAGGEEEIFSALSSLARAALTHADRMSQAGCDPTPSIETAASYAEAAVARARRSGNPDRETTSLAQLAGAWARLGRLDDALTLTREFQDLAARHGFRHAVRRAEHDLARLLLRLDRRDEAIERLEALVHWEPVGDDPELMASVHRELHGVYKSLGRMEEALAHHEAYHQLELRRIEQRSNLQARLLVNQIEVEKARHEAQRARLEADAFRSRAEELDRAAHEDSLTGLANRRYVDANLPRLLERASKRRRPLTAVLLDIDHFKRVNDAHGHPVGDRVLAQIGALLRDATRRSDVLARLGGEEFLVVFVDMPASRAVEACQRLRDQIRGYPWHELSPGLSLTVSLGLAPAEPEDTQQELLTRADRALYRAKHGGRDRVATA